MFIGSFNHSLDSKGRLFIPSRLREDLGERFIATKGLDRCLFLYPLSEWEIIDKKMRDLPFTKADTRAFVRMFYSGASECEVDKQGRILLPQNLRDFARITKDVVITGVSSRAEVWAKEEWDRFNQEAEAAYESMAESVAALNL
ncbi:MAG: division/cell wall cluster transcriptional repressor MraZ [Firmicutes bacterium]|nr:division/cell wall cluster transcriptional repressor MraZ [Bacillota bacterium]